MPNMPLRLGDVEFQELEAPAEIANLGGQQKIATFSFAGGIRSAQLYGAFPEGISWSGTLFGASAISRARTIDGLRTKGEPVLLSWAGWSYWGIVDHVTINPKNQWQIDYTIHFEPVQAQSVDNSSQVPMPPQSILANALNVAGIQAQTPFTAYTFSGQIVNQVQQLQQNTNSALQNSLNNISNLTPTQIQTLRQQISTLRNQLAPLIASVDPQQASAASDLDSTLQIVDRVISNNGDVLIELSVQNPNLFNLASAYYGDPAKWTLIAEANNLNDSNLTGTYRLIIPVDPGIPKPNTPGFLFS